jgi:cytochrome P450
VPEHRSDHSLQVSLLTSRLAMIEAGSETTSSTLNSAIKYLAAFPDAQSKAHAEITKIVGDDRSPTFDDEDSLPYIRAMVKEILRLRPTTSIGIQHFTTADVQYNGYFIPKDTAVSLNQYALHYDGRHKDPESFIPDRFLEHQLKAGAYAGGADPYERDHYSFGVGRRICPGLHVAENSLFITLAKLLWAFEIRAPLDSTGKEMYVDVSDNAYEEGAGTSPTPYRMRFIPRNAKREQALLAEWKDAQEEGYYLGDIKVSADGVVQKESP